MISEWLRIVMEATVTYLIIIYPIFTIEAEENKQKLCALKD
jgi:hypothetical protein